MELQKLSEWNPWWEKQEIAQELSGKERPSYAPLLGSLRLQEIIIITGVRRAGKSTLMYQMIQNLLKRGVDPWHIFFVNLEDKKLSGDSLDDMYLTYREHLNPKEFAYVFLDEVHKKDGWESWIRKKYDLKSKDKFVVSGSCSYLLKKEYSTLLTGRNVTFEVFPLSFKEFLYFNDVTISAEKLKKGIFSEETKIQALHQLQQYLRLGGFPQVLLTKEDYKMKVLAQYFDDILYKDIVDRYNLNAKKTRDLSLFLMANIGSFISLRSLRNALQLSYDTIKDCLSHYTDAFLFFTLDCFSYSFKEQKTLPSKLYCIDNGLRNSVSFMFSKDEGKLMENLIFLDLKRREKDVYYWAKKGEVDFVVKSKDHSLLAINVSYGDTIQPREILALLEFKKEFPKAELKMLTKSIEKKEDDVSFIPIWKWLLTTE